MCFILGPDDVEMEDLNYYYANYSRYVCCPWPEIITRNLFPEKNI